MRRPLGVRERMPRQPLSVILRGWHPLVANRTEKSAIAAHWEAASRSVLAPGAIRAHPLFRALCRGANASVVGQPTVIVTWLPFTFHFNQFTCTGHPLTCALAPLARHISHPTFTSVAQRSQRVGSLSKYIHGCAAPLNLRNDPNLNTEF